MTFQEDPEHSSGDHLMDRSPRKRVRRKRRVFFWAAFLPLIVLSGVLVNWALVIPTAFAAPVATSASGTLTYQHFLQESVQQQAAQGKGKRPTLDPKALKPVKPSKTGPLLPSAEPASMQDLDYVLDDSFVLHRPQMAAVKRTAAFQVQATSISAGTAPLVTKGSDGRLEVDLQRGSLDGTHATLASGQEPVGQLILQIHQISGHSIGERNLLGTYQIQVVDSLGEVVQGVTLTKPLTIVYHYQSWEMQDLDLDPNAITFAWSGQLIAAEAAKTSTAGLIAPMVNNASAQTLTVQTKVIVGTLTASGDEIAPPTIPDLYETSGNSGAMAFTILLG